MTETAAITIAIPTYRRESVLLETLRDLLALDCRASEILVLDQTPQHDAATELQLSHWNADGFIRWIRLHHPSIPAAMNAGLALAVQPHVLFLDDDVRPEPNLVRAHRDAHAAHEGVIVAGKVLQPWDEGRDYSADAHFHFATDTPRWIGQFMGGNFSLERQQALALGGFDENFVRVAYRFEAEFAHRWLAAGGRIRYEPDACLHHLKVGAGGTRTYGEHLTTWRPDHAVGAYYYGLRTRNLREFVLRLPRSVATRYHLRHPWQVPVTLLAELAAMAWGVALYLRGPSYADVERRKTSK